MSLSEYDLRVKPALNLIAAGAEMAARHARRLPYKPGFTTTAQDELAETQSILETALENIKTARAIYNSKPVEMQAAE